MSDANAVTERIRSEGIKVVELRFTDLMGRLRHLAFEAGGVDARLLGEGVFIDGSAVGGWREANEADLVLIPDLVTARPDPFAAQPTLVLTCDAADPASGVGYERDPRSAAKRAEQLLKDSPLAERVSVAVEIDVFFADRVETETGPLRQGAAVMLAGGLQPSPLGEIAGGSYLAAPPLDSTADLRAEVATMLATLGVAGVQHAPSRAPGLARFALPAAGLVAAADQAQLLRYVAHMVAASYGKTACLLAKPVASGPGAAFLVQQALWRGDRPLFAGQDYADLSPACLSFIAGVIAHGRALNAITNPSTNSYRRLRPEQDEPTLLAYAAHNRTAALRIPYAARSEGKRVEARFPDPTANPYLALTAILLAGLDGIERKLNPGEPVDRNLYDLGAAPVEGLTPLCRSLEEALDALEADHAFLARDEVMPAELIAAFVALKRQEATAVAAAPHPLELALYKGA